MLTGAPTPFTRPCATTLFRAAPAYLLHPLSRRQARLLFHLSAPAGAQVVARRGGFVGFLLLVGVFFQPIDKINAIIETYPKGIAGFTRYTQFLDTDMQAQAANPIWREWQAFAARELQPSRFGLYGSYWKFTYREPAARMADNGAGGYSVFRSFADSVSSKP